MKIKLLCKNISNIIYSVHFDLKLIQNTIFVDKIVYIHKKHPLFQSTITKEIYYKSLDKNQVKKYHSLQVN